ncbi:hypothetical protein [Bartonella refiksaydamii]|uniref:hypothetical protein n=1 Tax=Bartonella refiksaydamii TaxID=2654951 RepID=UPI0012EC6AF0|nr:hypothetical protein [Bartonella refiksaydamii]
MMKVFKNYVLNIFIVFAIFFSHVMNVNANHMRNNPQEKNAFISVTEQERKKTTYMSVFYIPSLNYEAGNEAAFEEKVEKVVEPITLGTFGIGVAIGYATTVVGMLLGWVINLIKSAIR